METRTEAQLVADNDTACVNCAHHFPDDPVCGECEQPDGPGTQRTNWKYGVVSGQARHLRPEVLLACATTWFLQVLWVSVENRDLVMGFDRLYGTNLQGKGTELELAIDRQTGRLDADLAAFVEFVYDTIFTRVEPPHA